MNNTNNFNFKNIINTIPSNDLIDRKSLLNIKGGADDPPPTTDEF